MMIERTMFRIGLLILISMVVLGCNTGGVVHDGITPESDGEGTPRMPSPSPTAVLPQVAREPADAGRLAQADLAERLGVEPEEIRVVEILRTELSPQQLQSGQPNAKFVSPAELLGYQVILRVGDVEYLYYVRLAQVVHVGPR
ncbi:MAG: hypothetical protein L6435_03705 [Anaerolineae bacterium]|nr:hypothetical protein [Anaerolineae bacterium]